MSAPKVRLPFNGKHRLTQHFGERPAVYKRFGLPGHNGIDWSIPEGVPIIAVDSGTIVLQEDDPTGFGLHIKIQHSWGQSLYAHLSEFKFSLNDVVQAGDVIALSGNTGFSSGAHLHFGLRVNPYKTNDGWYGYTNPHRFLRWSQKVKEEEIPPEPEEGIEEETPEPIVEPPTFDEAFYKERMRRLEEKLLESEEQIQVAAASHQFAQMELSQEADLWREAVTSLLERYMPGLLPREADVLVTLERLMEAWSEEIDTKRSELISSLFAPSPSE